MFFVQNLIPYCHIFLHHIMVLTLMQTTKEVKPYSHITPRINIGTPKIYQTGESTPIFQNHQHIYDPKRFEKPFSPLFLPLFSLPKKLHMLGTMWRNLISYGLTIWFLVQNLKMFCIFIWIGFTLPMWGWLSHVLERQGGISFFIAK